MGVWITRNAEFMYSEVEKGHAKGIYLSESFDERNKIDGVQPATVLFPDTTCLRWYFEGNTYGFEECYKQQLNESFRDDFLALIAFSVYRGNDIIIFKEETDIRYIHILVQVMENNYGIHIGDMDYREGYSFNEEYKNSNLCAYYLKDFIKPKEFISSIEVDDNFKVPMTVVEKIVDDDIIAFHSVEDKRRLSTAEGAYYFVNELLSEETAMRRGEKSFKRNTVKVANNHTPEIDISIPKIINTNKLESETSKESKETRSKKEVKEAMRTLFTVVKKEPPVKPKRKVGRPRKADKK